MGGGHGPRLEQRGNGSPGEDDVKLMGEAKRVVRLKTSTRSQSLPSPP